MMALLACDADWSAWPIAWPVILTRGTNKRMVEHLDIVVKGISVSLDGRKTKLEAKMQNQWGTFERAWEKIAQLEPGSKEGKIALAEYRISDECPS